MRLLYVVSILYFITPSNGANCKGSSDIDPLNFEKLTEAFPVSIIKFDKAFPYGKEHDEFCRLSEEAARVNNLFVGEVGIRNYGERDNVKFAESFNITDEKEYPVAYLFHKKSDGSVKQIRFNKAFTYLELKIFIQDHTEVYIPLAGCNERLDFATKEFMTDKQSRKAILDKISAEANPTDAMDYIKIMKRVISEGEEFVAKEKERVNDILSSSKKISPKKKEEMKIRLNVLQSFENKEEL